MVLFLIPALGYDEESNMLTITGPSTLHEAAKIPRVNEFRSSAVLLELLLEFYTP